MSNPLTPKRLDVVVKATERGWTPEEPTHQALHAPARPRIRDVVDVDELARFFREGRMIKELAREYTISESSVNRILRVHGARRR